MRGDVPALASPPMMGAKSPRWDKSGTKLRKEKAAGKGIIDRASAGGRGTIRARVNRSDKYGTVHNERGSWNYHDVVTRRDAIDKAEDWLRATKRRIRDSPELRAEAEARGTSTSVRQLIADYADDLGHTIAEVEIVDKDNVERTIFTHNRERRRRNRNGEPVIDKTDIGARQEVMNLRGWLGGFTAESPMIANLIARDITSDDIEHAIAAMGHEVSNDTKRRRLSVLVAVGRRAEAAGEPHLLAALRGAVWPAKSDLAVGREITHPEWQAIMAHTRLVEPLTVAAMRWLRWTACRRSEALRLAWEDIAEEDGAEGTAWRVHIRNTKNPIKTPVGKLRSAMGRKPPIDDAAWDALLLAAQAQHARTGHGPNPRSVRALKDLLRADQSVLPVQRAMRGGVFAGLKGESVSNAWRRITERAGVDARLHDLRHTRTSEYVRQLGSILEAAAMTGHSDVKMLQLYHHPDASAIERKQRGAVARGSVGAKKRIAASRKAEADAAKRRGLTALIRRKKRAGE